LAVDPESAWPAWRNCLRLSPRRLPDVVRESSLHLSPGEVLERVLPEEPGVLVAAARLLFPGPEGDERRGPFLDRALELLRRQGGAARGEDFLLLARVHAERGEDEEALAAYQAALAREPERLAWRLELAGHLRDRDQLPEAQRELKVILARDPRHAEATALLAAVERALARQR
jgi:tetratricopeptide (TPR) repeat protein